MTRPAGYKNIGGVNYKKCSRCHQWKEINDANFAPSRAGHLGLHPFCRSCIREYNRKYYPTKKRKIRKPIPKLSASDPTRAQVALPDNARAFLRRACKDLGPEPVHKAYLIRNTKTGAPYIGVTVRKLSDRWRQHILTALNNDDGYLVHQAIREVGLENFEFRFLACARNLDDLYAVERALIQQYDSVRSGYNQTTGGGASEAIGKEVQVAGKTFISLNAAARHYGIPEYSVAQRIARYGWSLEQALELMPRPKKPARRRPLTVGEIEFPNLEEACRAHGQTSSAVRRRLSVGWTLEQALGLIVSPPKGIPKGTQLSVAGVDYPNIAAAARTLGIKPGTVRFRLRKGYTVRRALGLDPLPKTQAKGTSISIQGNAYPSVSEAARHYGVDAETASSRINRGWTIEQAFGVASPPDRSLPGYSVEVGGIVYKSRAAAARAYGLSPKLVHKRIVELGWSLEEALGIKPRLT